MAKLPDGQIATLARNAGWKGTDLPIAVAVALAESGGDTAARGDTGLVTSKWGPSIGLWQIRSLNAEKGKGTTRDELANVDPATNARHAHEIWQGQGWGPWTTFGVGKYLLFMPRATAAVTGIGGDIAGGVVGGAGGAVAGAIVPDTASAILDVAREPLRFVEWLKQPINVGRIMQVVIGGMIIVAGLSIVVATSTGKSMAGVKEAKKILS